MRIRLLPLLTGLMPIIAIHASYLIGIQAGRLPACIPYLVGCTSVSATGRYPPASFLFKAIMLPNAVLLLLYWLCVNAWLKLLEQPLATSRHSTVPRIAVLGGGGSLALIIYLTFLGTNEPIYEFMRRFGIYLFFLFTILAQLDLSLRLRRCARSFDDAILLRLANRLFALAALPFLLGALNLTLKAVMTDADRPENVIEWIVVLMIQIHIALTYFAWRRTGFESAFSVSQR